MSDYMFYHYLSVKTDLRPARLLNIDNNNFERNKRKDK